MTFHFLNINEEPTASLLFGRMTARDGEAITVLYELQEGSFQRLLPYVDELLESVSRILGIPETSVVLAYHRLRYSGVWYKYKPLLEPQDTQSLDFMGFDDDEVRVAARDTKAYGTIHIRIDGFAKETNKVAVFEVLDYLWSQSVDAPDFKARVTAWAVTDSTKDVS